MLNRYSVIAIAFLSVGAQNAFADNDQAQRMILGGNAGDGPALPVASTYKPQASGQDEARALIAPDFVSSGYVGTSATVDVDGHEQARRMIEGQ